MKISPRPLITPSGVSRPGHRLFTRPISRRASLFAVSVVMLLAGQSAQAAPNVLHTLTTTGASNTSTATWTNGAPTTLTAGDLALFSTAGQTATSTVDVNFTIGSLKTTGTAGVWTINGGTITLDGTGLTAANSSFGNAGTAYLVNGTTTANGLTVNSNLVIANTNLDIGSNNSGSMLVGGNITALTAQSINFRANGAGAVNDTGSIGASGSNIDISNLGTSTGAVTLGGALGAMVTSVTQNSATSSLTLSGANTAFAGTIALQAGTLNLNNANALGNTGAGGTFTITGGTLSNTSAGTVTLASTNAEAWNGDFSYSNTAANLLNLGTGAVTMNATRTITSTGAGSLTVGGIISGSGFGLTKAGASSGALILTGANAYTGLTSVTGGTMQISGAAGSIASSSGLTVSGNGVASTGANASGLFILDKSAGTAVDALKDTGAITLGTGGEFQLKNTTTSTNSTETVGNIVVGAGNSTITVIAPTTGIMTLASTGSLSRTGSGTALLRGTNFAQSSTTSAGRITVATAPNGADFVGTNILNNGAINDTTQALKIVPWLLGDITATATGTRFVTYDSTLGFRALLSGETTTLAAGSMTQAAPVNAVVATGTTTVTAPNLTVNSLMLNTASPTLDGSGVLTVNSGAVGATFNTTSADVIGSGWSSLALGNGEGIIHVISGVTLTINTPISVTGSGSGGLTKGEAGNLILNGVNTYTGPTTINQGNLTIGGAGQLNSGNYSGALSLLGGGTFTYGSSADQALSGGITLGTGALTKSGTSTLTISGTGSSYTGNTTINGGTLKYGIDQATPIGSSITINATTASGSATLDLNGFNSSINTAAPVIFGGTGAGANAINTLATGAGTLTLSNAANGTSVTYNATNNPGTATLSGNLNLGGNRTFNITDSTNTTNELNVSALVSNGTVTKIGAGTLTLANPANSFGGTLLINAGILNAATLTVVGSTSALGNAGAIVLDNGALLQYTAANGPQSTSLGLTISGAGGGLDASGASISDTVNFTGAFTVTGTTNRSFTLTGTNTGSNTLAGALINSTAAAGGPPPTTGVISLVKSGTGTWAVTGASTYTGTTTVSAGTLTVDSAGATTARLAGTTGVSITGGMLLLANSTTTTSTDRINNAATVTLNGGTLNTGGLSEGVATGTSAATTGLGALTLTSTSTLDFGLGHTGSSVLAFADSSAQTWNGTLALLNFTPGTDELNFANSGLTTTQLSQISLAGFAASGFDSFGDVAFTAVPEPSTAIAPTLFLAFLLWRERSRLRGSLNAARGNKA